jgi:Spy/CpxP family protein refolding chaperone
MTMTRLMTAFALVAALATPAFAQTAATTNMDILRQKVKADKKLLVAQNLSLTDAEAAAFWPVYDAYQKELQPINDRMAATIMAYAKAYNAGPVTNDTAKMLIEQSAAIDAAEATLKTSSQAKILAALPATKAARYIQIENKIRAMIRYELAANIPFVQ